MAVVTAWEAALAGAFAISNSLARSPRLRCAATSSRLDSTRVNSASARSSCIAPARWRTAPPRTSSTSRSEYTHACDVHRVTYTRRHLRYDYQTNHTFQRFPRSDVGTTALADDILATLRKPTFRVIAFADFWKDRVYSQIGTVGIEFTVPVAERLTAITTPDDLTCRQDAHTRRGARWGQKWQSR